MATKLPKGKEKIVQEAGATRRRTLSVVLAAMERNLTKSELASRMKLTERTIERILDDAVKVGFKKYTNRAGKVLLLHKKGQIT